MKPSLFASIDAFRAAAKDGAEVGEAKVLASFGTEIKAGEGDSRAMTFTISTAALDRQDDTIAVDGWKLDNYRKNPVVLWAHDSSSLPVGKAPKVWMAGGKLQAETEFTPKGMARFNDTVFDMLKGGFLNATSVGFSPIKYAFSKDPNRDYGIDFIEQDLLEFSIVPVPANPEALVESRAAGIDLDPVLDWASGLLGKSVDRVRALADQVLGAEGQDLRDIDWARQVAAKSGLGLFPLTRIEAIERAAKAQRLAQKRQLQTSLLSVRAPTR